MLLCAPGGPRAGLVKVLEKVVVPWMNEVAGGRPYVFQQDSAPAHASKMTQAWLLNNVPNHWSPDLWPPNSPDLNPLDHFMWGVLETKTNNRFHPNMDSIRQSVIEEFSLLERDLVIKACKVFRTRIEQVIALNGGYTEQL